MNEPIKLFRPTVSEAAIDAVAEVLRSGWYGTGPRTAAFERAFATYCGADQCVGTSTGTDALVLAMTIAGVEAREVVTTAMTYVATAHAIVRAGGTPVFADIDASTGNLDPSSVADRITERTGAIAVVHYAGTPADLDELHAIAGDRGLRVIEDCAHATGATYRGHPVGGRGDLHAFSFQATKNLTAAGGGALTLNNDVESARARRLRAQGVDRDFFTRADDGGSAWDYLVTEVGFSCAMSDLQAAIGLVHLGLLDADNRRRASIAARYRERLREVVGIGLLDTPDDRTSSNYLCVVLADGRDALIEKLALEGVGTGVHFRRIDSHPAYQLAELPVTEWFGQRCVSLPVHLELTDDDVDRVCDLIERGW